MSSPSSTIASLFRGLRPALPDVPPVDATRIRLHLADLVSFPPKDIIAALAPLAGEIIERATEFNQLKLLAETFAAHGTPAERLTFAKCAALRGAQPPAGGDQPGAGAAAVVALVGEPAPGLVQDLKIEKGQFPQILVDGIYWNAVWTARGKYVDPPPIHDDGALMAWNAAVARAANAPLAAACLRGGAAALGRFGPEERKGLLRVSEDPFGLRAAKMEAERMKSSRRAPVEGLLWIVAADVEGAALDLNRAERAADDLARIFRAALELEDAEMHDLLGRAVGAHCVVCPLETARDPAARKAWLARALDERRAARLGAIAAALERGAADLMSEPRRKALVYARVAIASLARRERAALQSLAALTPGGETADPVMAALEKRYLEKTGAVAAGAPTGATPARGIIVAAATPPRGIGAGGPGGAAERAARSPWSDILRPREMRDGVARALDAAPEPEAHAIADKALAESIGPDAAAAWRAAFARGFEAGLALAVVHG